MLGSIGTPDGSVEGPDIDFGKLDPAFVSSEGLRRGMDELSDFDVEATEVDELVFARENERGGGESVEDNILRGFSLDVEGVGFVDDGGLSESELVMVVVTPYRPPEKGVAGLPDMVGAFCSQQKYE